jgi:hypothetical protein
VKQEKPLIFDILSNLEYIKLTGYQAARQPRNIEKQWAFELNERLSAIDDNSTIISDYDKFNLYTYINHLQFDEKLEKTFSTACELYLANLIIQSLLSDIEQQEYIIYRKLVWSK